MITTTKPMSAENLVLCLAGEHCVTPEDIIETIKGNAGLWAKVRSYGKGLATYESVSETLANYI